MIDLSNPSAIIQEAQRRNARRAQGLSLGVLDEVPAVVAPSNRAWPRTAIELPRPRSVVRETPEQNAIVKLLKACRCKVEPTSQKRASKVALGIPDLWVFLLPISRSAWIEVKSGDDWSFSNPQLEWAERCLTTDTLYACGDRYSVAAFLRFLGLVIPPEYDYR